MIQLQRALRGLAALCFSAALVHFAIPYFGLSKGLLAFPTAYLTLATVAVTMVAAVWPATSPRGRLWRIEYVALVLATVLAIPFAFSAATFGTMDIGSILITMQENSAADVWKIGLEGFSQDIFGFAVATALLLGTSAFLITRVSWFRWIALCIAGIAVVTSPVTVFAVDKLLPNPAHALIVPQRDVQPPVLLAAPERQKNLIVIYMESVERTYDVIPATATAFGPLRQIDRQAISVRNIRQLNGTGFTAGGIVATQCGVPLYPNGVFAVQMNQSGTLHTGVTIEQFMPGVTCLGDILARAGYTASFLTGSDPGSFAIGSFFQTHGYQHISGVASVPAWQTETRRNIWGVNDDPLFEQAGVELDALAAGGKPFVLSIETISTHGPDGFLDKSCTFQAAVKSNIPAAIHCTGLHVQGIIDRVEALGLTEDTVIAVMNDHLSMKNTVYADLLAMGDKRSNYFVLLGAGPARVIEKPGTMIDVFPTLLEALGYQIKEGRANMGVSLLSEYPTLTQTLGLDVLNDAVDGHTELQRLLWSDAAATAQK